MAAPHTTWSNQGIETKLARFIADELLDEELPEGIDPLTADAVDSLGLEQIVEYIRAEFGVAIADQEMVGENFESIATLAALVERKQVREETT
jgi:acyl carrier protein